MNHLIEKAKVFVKSASKERRIENCRVYKWIGYPVAHEILTEMNTLLTYPKRDRMRNMLIVGDSNNGKTAILSKFDQANEATIDAVTGKQTCPVLMIQAPPEPDEKRFYNAILDKLFAPSRTSEKIDSRFNRVKNLLTEMDVKVLLIDEIHHVLAGSPSKQRLFLNVIKYLSNELKISLICAGTDLAYNAIQSDNQLSNRFHPWTIPRWENTKDYKRLLNSFTRILPLKEESLLTEKSIADKILAYSDGLIGEISTILELSTIMAIESGVERITKTVIDSINYTPPMKRKKTKYY